MSVALFTSRSGIQGLLSCNWAFLANPGRNLQHPHEEIRIQGTKGAIYGNSEDMTVHFTEPEVHEIKPAIEGTWFPDAFGNAMAHFLGVPPHWRETYHTWTQQSTRRSDSLRYV